MPFGEAARLLLKPITTTSDKGLYIKPLLKEQSRVARKAAKSKVTISAGSGLSLNVAPRAVGRGG